MVGFPTPTPPHTHLTKHEPKQTWQKEKKQCDLGAEFTWAGMVDACSGVENMQEMKVAAQTRKDPNTKLRNAGVT